MNLCLLEAGILPAHTNIQQKRVSFIQSKRSYDDADGTFHFVYLLCREANTPGYRCLDPENMDADPLETIRAYIR